MVLYPHIICHGSGGVSCRHLKHPNPSGSAPHALHTWQAVAAAARRSLSQRIPSKPNLKFWCGVTAARATKGNPKGYPAFRGQVWQTIFFQGACLSQFDGVTHKSPGHNTHLQDCSWSYESYPPYVPLEAMWETQKETDHLGMVFTPHRNGDLAELLQARSARIRGVNAKDRGWRPTWPLQRPRIPIWWIISWDYSGYPLVNKHRPWK